MTSRVQVRKMPRAKCQEPFVGSRVEEAACRGLVALRFNECTFSGLGMGFPSSSSSWIEGSGLHTPQLLTLLTSLSPSSPVLSRRWMRDSGPTGMGTCCVTFGCEPTIGKTHKQTHARLKRWAV
eukprot:2097949-Pyramimonas_sp.AAC.1